VVSDKHRDSTYFPTVPLLDTLISEPIITQPACSVQIDLSQKHLIRDVPVRGAPTLAKRKKKLSSLSQKNKN
jgi:hypothetical protein